MHDFARPFIVPEFCSPMKLEVHLWEYLTGTLVPNWFCCLLTVTPTVTITPACNIDVEARLSAVVESSHQLFSAKERETLSTLLPSPLCTVIHSYRLVT